MTQPVSTHDSRAAALGKGHGAAAHPINKRWRISWRWIHKWGGIISALWLGVLGITGFLLDHRDWRWIWQVSVSEALFPEQFLKEHRRAEFTVYLINPDDNSRRLSGGKRGLWVSIDGGKNWVDSRFEGMRGSPQILAVIEDQRRGWARLYAATDDGVWLSVNGGGVFIRIALRGEYINSIAFGHDKGSLLCSANRSDVYEIDAGTGAAAELDIKPAGPAVAAGKIGLSRFVHDLHFGRGLISGLGSLLINDLGGIMLVLLPITGILFWLLPLLWRGREAAATHDGRMMHRFTMKALHRSHGLYFGLISAIPIAYLALTGIILDHRDLLNDWMKKVQISKSYLPPVYDLRSWDGEIQSVIGHPGEPHKLSIGARSGLYASNDNGASWKKEELPGPPSCFVWSISRLGENIFIGGMGCPNAVMGRDGVWKVAQGAGHMPASAAMLVGGKVTMLSHGALYIGDFEKGFTKSEITLPRPGGEPLFTLLDGLHSGLILHKQWIWVNDAVSLLAIILCVSGIIRIWRSRRIIARDFKTAKS